MVQRKGYNNIMDHARTTRRIYLPVLFAHHARHYPTKTAIGEYVCAEETANLGLISLANINRVAHHLIANGAARVIRSAGDDGHASKTWRQSLGCRAVPVSCRRRGC